MELNVQELPKTERIGGSPTQSCVPNRDLEVAEQQHPEGAARCQARPGDAVGVKLRSPIPILAEQGNAVGLGRTGGQRCDLLHTRTKLNDAGTRTHALRQHVPDLTLKRTLIRSGSLLKPTGHVIVKVADRQSSGVSQK